jgi:4-hydroxybenzoate polyprenyltransferase
LTFYRNAIAVFGVVFVGIGVALVVVTAINGGGALGYILGALFAALGIGRLYLLRARR